VLQLGSWFATVVAVESFLSIIGLIGLLRERDGATFSAIAWRN